MIDGLNIDDTEKSNLRDIAEHEARFKVKEAATTEKTAEKALRVSQSATYTVARTQVMQETQAANLLALLHKIPGYKENGVLDREDGDKLTEHIQACMSDLLKPNPEEDVAAIVNDITYRIVSNPGSIPADYIFSVRGLSTATRARLESLQTDRKSQGGYKDIPAYTDSIKLINSLDNTKVQIFNYPGLAAPPNMAEFVSRAVIAYDNEIETRATKLGRRLNSAEIHELDPYREQLIAGIKTQTYKAAPGQTVDQLLK